MDLHKRIAALELDHSSVTAAEYEAAIYALCARTHAKLRGDAVLPPEPSARVLAEGQRRWPPDPGVREKLLVLLERKAAEKIDAPGSSASRHP